MLTDANSKTSPYSIYNIIYIIIYIIIIQSLNNTICVYLITTLKASACHITPSYYYLIFNIFNATGPEVTFYSSDYFSIAIFSKCFKLYHKG